MYEPNTRGGEATRMIEVAAAIIENERGKLLIARRGPGKSQAGLWEFPGGKLESGESAADCLRRELVEEMSIEIEPYAFYAENEHAYGDRTIRLSAWKAAYRSGTIQLTDHDEYRWASRAELGEYEFAPADVMFVELLTREE